jgi:integrase/recombinase XerC
VTKAGGPVSEGAYAALEDWLAALTGTRGRSDNTAEAYRRDLLGFLGFLSTHRAGTEGTGGLANVTHAEMRAWMAHERSHGLSPRSLARALSSVKSFYRWLAHRDGFDPTAVLSVRSPKFTKKLPRPLAIDAAQAVIDRVEVQASEPWVAARDTAVVTVLYGLGLRISEALGLTGADAPLPEVLRIRGKGGKERIVPVINPARDAVEAYRTACR